MSTDPQNWPEANRAHDIIAREFRQIIYWPLALSADSLGEQNPRDVINKIAESLDRQGTLLTGEWS